jgi:hypothetical protein
VAKTGRQGASCGRTSRPDRPRVRPGRGERGCALDLSSRRIQRRHQYARWNLISAAGPRTLVKRAPGSQKAALLVDKPSTHTNTHARAARAKEHVGVHSLSAQAARRPGGGPRRFPRPVASCTSDAAGAAAVQCRRARGSQRGRACIPRQAPGDRPRALATRAATLRRAAAAARWALGGAPSQCMRPRTAKPAVLPARPGG